MPCSAVLIHVSKKAHGLLQIQQGLGISSACILVKKRRRQVQGITWTHLQAPEVCRRCSNTSCITVILGLPWLPGCNCYDTAWLCEERHTWVWNGTGSPRSLNYISRQLLSDDTWNGLASEYYVVTPSYPLQWLTDFHSYGSVSDVIASHRSS